MKSAIFSLLVALVVLMPRVCAQESAVCSAQNTAKFRFSVSSRRNETGHRLVGVRILNGFEYGSPADAESELTVDVEHSTGWCNNSEVIITTAHAEAPPVRFRRPDYELFSELGYYKLHTKPLTWEQAKITCMKEGTHLLIVNSEGEAGVVKSFFSRKPIIQGATWTDYAFVGYSDRAVEGQYVTVLGQPLSSSGYAKWVSGNPSNTAGCTEPDSDCVGVYKDGLLNDLPCLCKAAFICEQEI